MSAFTSEQVLEVLKEVMEPDQEQDIVSLGYVKNLAVKGKRVSFTIEFPKSGNPFAKAIRKEAVQAIKKKLGDDVEIEGLVEITARDVVHEEKTLPDVKNIVAVASGKGGVGKSTVAVNLAVALAREGYRVGLIDADVYGPSTPKMFDLEGARPELKKINGKDRIIPVEKYGVRLLSIGFFVDPNDALVWRGPMATGALKQIIHDGYWDDLDYLLIDLPPGTGDVHLTLVQTLPVSGAIIVSTPQPVALADAIKGISMFTGEHINVPVLGLVENMSWFTPEELPDNKYYIFGKEGCRDLAKKMNVPLLGEIPLVQGIREGGDNGSPVALDENTPTGEAFIKLARETVKQLEIRHATKEATKIVEIKNR